MFKESEEIIDEDFQSVLSILYGTLPQSSYVVGDHMKIIFQGFDLRCPHFMVNRKAMDEHNGWFIRRTRLLISDRSTKLRHKIVLRKTMHRQHPQKHNECF